MSRFDRVHMISCYFLLCPLYIAANKEHLTKINIFRCANLASLSYMVWNFHLHCLTILKVMRENKRFFLLPLLKIVFGYNSAAWLAHWLKVNERIEYKLLSLTYKVLSISQPSYLNNLISVQPPRSTRSSSVVTLYRPPAISDSSLTNAHYDSLRQPRQSCLDSLPHSPVNSSLSLSPLSSSITLSLQTQNLPFQQILPTLILVFYPGLPSRSRDRTGLIIMFLDLFLVRFFL